MAATEGRAIPVKPPLMDDAAPMADSKAHDVDAIRLQGTSESSATRVTKQTDVLSSNHHRPDDEDRLHIHQNDYDGRLRFRRTYDEDEYHLHRNDDDDCWRLLLSTSIYSVPRVPPVLVETMIAEMHFQRWGIVRT